MRSDLREWICRLMALVSWTYLAILFAWLLAYLVAKDHLGYLGLINLVAVYLFFPLPVVLLTALVCRSRGLGVAFLIGGLAFLWLWGGLFLPRSPRAQAGGSQLTVMTFNVLATHCYTQPILDTIRAEDPDVVLIQELNNNLAGALQAELGAAYPYQVLHPLNSATGIGTISKYPLQEVPASLPQRWIGGPVVTEMQWNGRSVLLVNFHMLSTPSIRSTQQVLRDFNDREAQARMLVNLARQHGSAILGGDANSVPISNAHAIFTTGLQDAWIEAGFGLGHTFPSRSTVPGSDRPMVGPFYSPPWLARIDYVLHTGDWRAVSARLAKIDGVSDHRGVVAILRPQD